MTLPRLLLAAAIMGQPKVRMMEARYRTLDGPPEPARDKASGVS